MRFEIADSDDNEGSQVGMDTAFAKDGLNLMEGVLATQLQSRRKLYENDVSNSSERANSGHNNSLGRSRQLLYRDKEEYLVQTALDRIRRAQALGESNVRLTKSELHALERKQQKNMPAGITTASSGRTRPTSTVIQRDLAVAEPNRNIRKVMPSNSGDDGRGASFHGRPIPRARASLLEHEHDLDLFTGNYGRPGVIAYSASTLSGMPPSGSHDWPHQYTPPAHRLSEHDRRYSYAPEVLRPTVETPILSRPLPDDPNWVPRPRPGPSSQPQIIGDVQNSAYAHSVRQMGLSRPQCHRIVYDRSITRSAHSGRGSRPSMVVATQPQPSLVQLDGHDGSVSLPAHANGSGDDSCNDHSAEVEYLPYPDLGMYRSHYEEYPRSWQGY